MLLISRRTDSRVSTLFDRDDAGPDPLPDPSTAEVGMNRSQLMHRIMLVNPSAKEEYLGEFGDASLARYLAHLELLGSPRGARWERPGDTPAIIVRETEF